jgi:uncharacterized repeat protein (TIGR02543 family)
MIYYKQFGAVLEMKKEKKLLLLLALVLVGLLLFSSIPASAGANPGRGKSLAEARKGLEQELLPLAGAGFVGIAHSEAEGDITVFVENEQAKQRVPQSFDGHPVQTEVTGKIQAFSTQVAEPLTGVSAERLGEVRPLVGGTSLSAYVTKGAGLYLYAGTLGMVTYNDKILSNAHVIAMNPDTYNFLNTGTPIIQPGSYDGGRSGDHDVGTLEKYIPINFAPNAKNYADAAIGSIDVGVNASPGEQFSETGDYWIGGWTSVSQGDTVRKSGRTTGVTSGEVLYPNVSVVVSYGSKSAYFADQIVVTQDNWSFAQPGDSGSVVDKDGKFVGLLFAGSAGYAVICKAKYIIDGLSIDVEPPVNQYSLTISSTPGGNVTSPGEGTYIYKAGAVVNLTAQADTGNHYHFAGWTGNATSAIGNITAASTNITMNDSYSITANFALEPGWHSLTISSTPGGNVTEPGVGTTYVYGNSTVVNLTAVPDDHYHFVAWTGNITTIADPTAASTNITMNDSYSITANFALEPGWYSLTVSSTPGGNVTSPGEGTYIYKAGAVVNLTAQADTGYQFVGWTGNVGTIANSTAASTNITMNDSYSITANFALEPGWYSLTISSTPGGNVTEPGVGTHVYSNSTVVNLMAVPDTGYQFVGWTGDVGTIGNVSAAETTITMNGSYYITANFGLWQPEPRVLLTVSSKGGGSVTTPGEGTFLDPLGAKVTLVAVPDEGGQFVKWSGDVSTIDNVLAPSTTITMDNSYSIRADFSGAGLRCFIATAAYGTPMAEEVQTLRDFRDEYLLTNPIGQALVSLYYNLSPPMAEFITEHPSLKPIVRAGLVPAVAMSRIAVNATPSERVAMVGLLVLILAAAAIWAMRRRARDSEHI